MARIESLASNYLARYSRKKSRRGDSAQPVPRPAAKIHRIRADPGSRASGMDADSADVRGLRYLQMAGDQGSNVVVISRQPMREGGIRRNAILIASRA